jgi:Mrp family chromosome partitioning ATPase
MSRNFELLQEIGGDSELFGLLPPLPDAVSVVDEEPLPDLDKEMREAILRNATLPSVVETPDEFIPPAAPASAEHKSRTAVNDSRKSSLDFSQNDVFGSFGNLTSPVDFSTLFPELSGGNGGRVLQTEHQESGRSRKVFQEDSTSRKLPPGLNPGMFESLVETIPTKVRRKRPFGPRWIDSIKATTDRWRHKLQKEYGLPEAELEAIAREEEAKLVQRVFPGTTQDSPRVAVFSGLGGDQGSASVCARTGELLAARGEGPVCVVDANFESPSLHRHFGTENTRGLAEAILERGPIKQYIREIDGSGLCFMPHGRTSLLLSPAEITDRFRTRIAEARASFWYVVIHAGFLGLNGTAMMISSSTDGVVLVVEANRTRRESAKRVKENLLAANVRLLGVVLNNRTYPIPKALYRIL